MPGFELLDNFSEELSAGDNLVTAETPFSLQLSVCLWVNPSWIRRSKYLIFVTEILYYSNDKFLQEVDKHLCFY